MASSLYSDLNQYLPTQVSLLKDVEAIHQSLHVIISTRKGEIPFKPEFGLNLEDELFEIIDEVTALDVFRIVTEGVAQQEPRVEIDLSNTTVEPQPELGIFDLTLTYSVRGLGNRLFEFQGAISSPELQ